MSTTDHANLTAYLFKVGPQSNYECQWEPNSAGIEVNLQTNIKGWTHRRGRLNEIVI